MKIKLFSAHSESKLETKVNTFLGTCETVVDIKYSVTYDCDDFEFEYCAMVIYK